ncbi:MAG: hypothetical protein Q9215_007255 [Flavoplaca cf. flavocitrina]
MAFMIKRMEGTSHEDSTPRKITLIATNTTEVAVTVVFGVLALVLAVATLWQARRHWETLRQVIFQPSTATQNQDPVMSQSFTNPIALRDTNEQMMKIEADKQILWLGGADLNVVAVPFTRGKVSRESVT